MYTIMDLLKPQVLTTSYSRRKALRPLMLTSDFYKTPENVDGNEATLFFDPEEQTPAPGNVPGSSARILELGDATEKRIGLFYAFNKIILKDDIMHALREPESSSLQQMARTEIDRQLSRFRWRHQINKEQTFGKILFDGKVYLDNQGRVLESSSGAVITADMGVAAGHQGDVGGIFAALWSTPATSIQDQLERLKNKASEDGVEEPTEIYVDAVNKRHLRANTEFKAWAQAHQELSREVLRGSMLPDLWGFNWHFIGGHYVNTSGTKSPFASTTKGLICPAPAASGWIRATAGSNHVPTSIEIKTDALALLSNLTTLYGEFAYASLSHDPVALNMFMGDKYGLHFADPGAVWQPTLFA